MHLLSRTGALVSALALAAAVPAAAQQFGSAVAAGGGQAFVGQPANDYAPGMVYVYTRNGQNWQRSQVLTGADSAANDGFGSAIALDGQSLLIGAVRADSGRGRVGIFRKQGNQWRQTGRLTPAAGTEKIGFGGAVAVGGDVAAVAATGADSNTGSVYVYRRSQNGWTQDTILRPTGLGHRSFFGAAIATDGTMLAIGAAGADSSSGAVYVYRNTPTGWTQDTRLALSGPLKTQMPARFGSAVAIHDGAVLVGMPMAFGQTGAVMAYMRDSASGRWRTPMRLQAFDATPGGRFGTAIAFAGNEVWVGAPGANRFQGAIYRFQHDGEHNITGITKMMPDSLEGPGFFGAAIAVGDGGAAVGLPFFESGFGAAHLPTLAGNEWRVGQRVLGDEHGLEAITGSQRNCRDGKVGMFECRASDLMAFLPIKDIGGSRGSNLNDIWGWTDPETGKEYALVGRTDGTSFVDISNPTRPVYLGNLPRTEGSPPAAWRDIKVYKNHAYIVADASQAHGVQVFDLTRLRNVSASNPQTFTPDTTYHNVHSAHNIVINEESGYAYAVGSSSGGETCGGGLHMIDIRDPKVPKFAGCFSDPATGNAGTGYSHDAQCVMYHGPDTRYTGREICLGSNETALSVADVTDKSNPVAISRASYPNVGYTHQGWFDEEQRYFYMNDEGDESAGTVKGTRTIVWDLQKLDDPVVAHEYIANVRAIDHNLYVKGDFVYESNYTSGLRVLDIRNRAQPVEVAFFDTVPVGGDEPSFAGSWSNYPYFKSGVIAVTSIGEGLFLVKKRDTQPVP